MNQEKPNPQLNPESESRKELLDKIDHLKELGDHLDIADKILDFDEKEMTPEDEEVFADIEAMRAQLADLEEKTKRAGEELIGKEPDLEEVDDTESTAENDEKKSEETDETEGQNDRSENESSDRENDPEKVAKSEDDEEEKTTDERSAEPEELDTGDKKKKPENPEEIKKKKNTTLGVNEAEKMDKYEHFTRREIAELIESGLSNQEIWEKVKSEGVFFKFDGSSYYLSGHKDIKENKRREKDSEEEQGKYTWRGRSATKHTHSNYKERVMFGYIEKALEDYRELLKAYPSLKDAIMAADMVQENEQKYTTNQIMNKVMPMSLYWEKISGTITGYEAPEVKEGEDEGSNSESETNPEFNGSDSAEESSSENDKSENEEVNERIKEMAEADDDDLLGFNDLLNESDAEDTDFEDADKSEENSDEGQEEKPKTPESVEELSEGDMVYYMEMEMRRWRDPKKIDAIVEVNGIEDERFAKFNGEDNLFPLNKLELATDTDTNETEFRPTTESEAGVYLEGEDLDNVPDGEELSEEIAELQKFSERFGISVEELDQIEGFPQDRAEIRWVFENLTQLTTGRIAAMAKERQKKALAAEIPDEWQTDAGGRIKNFMNWAKISGKTLWEKRKTENHAASFEQEIKKEIQNGGISEHGDTIKQLVQSLDEADFGVSIDEKTDEIKFDFIQMPEDTNPELHRAIENYNDVADKMAKTPDEWRLDSATKNQRRKHENAKLAFEKARKELFSARIPEMDNVSDYEVIDKQFQETAMYLHEKDYAVRMNQLLNTNPKASRELDKIADDSSSWKVWGRTFNKTMNGKNATKLAIGVSGIAARWATASVTFGIGAVPVAASVGALRGRIDANYKLREKSDSARYGGIDNIDGLGELVAVRDKIEAVDEKIASADTNDEKAQLEEERKQLFGKRDELVRRSDIRQKLFEAGAMVNAGDLIERLERDLDLVADAEEGSNQHQSRLQSLDARLQYTVNKLEQGVVNFGADASSAAFSKLNISQKMADAQTAIDLATEDSRNEIFDKWQESIGLKNDVDTEAAREQFRDTQTKWGAGIGASLFTGGWIFGHILDVGGHTAAESSVDAGADQWPGPPSESDSLSTGGSEGFTAVETDSTVAGSSGMQGAPDDMEQIDSTKVDSTTADTTQVEPATADTLETISPDTSTAEADTVQVSQPETADVDTAKLGDQQFAPAATDSAAADSTVAEESPEGGQESPSSSAEGAETVPVTPEQAEALGVQEVVIDERGEGMIHAIADTLEEKFEIPHDQAMRIGNELYIKGEQAEGTAAEMYNLVGKGSSFSLDFGDLTAQELQEGSAQDLVENIEFSQETFDAGPSGIEGLDVPVQEATDQASASTGAEDVSRQTYSIETRDLDTPSYDLSSLGDLETRTAGMDLDRFREVLDRNDVTADIQDRLDEGINSSRMSTSSTYEGIRVSALSDLRDYLYAHSEQNIVDTVEEMREDNPRLLLTLDKVIALEDPDHGGPMYQLDKYISTGYLDMYAHSEDVSIPRPGPESASDTPAQPAGGGEDAAESSSNAPADTGTQDASTDAVTTDIPETRPENPIQTQDIDGITIEQANEQAAAAEKAAWQEKVNANPNIDVTTVGEAQNPSVADSNFEKVRAGIGEDGIVVDEPEVPHNASETAASANVDLAEVDKVSVSQLEAIAIDMEMQKETGNVNVPAEKFDELEAYFAENSTRDSSDAIHMLAESNPELLTVFERAIDLDDNGGIIDSESLKPLRRYTWQLVSQLTEEDFPNGIPDYAVTSIEESKRDLR